MNGMNNNIGGNNNFFDDVFKTFFRFANHTILNIKLDVDISLKLAFYGGVKEITFQRKDFTKTNFTVENVTLKINLPPLIEQGQSFMLKGEGHKYIGSNSNLEIKFNVLSLDNLYRKGNDLYQNVDVNIFDVLTNKTIIVRDIF